MKTQSQPPAGFFGRSVLRLEDRKLLRGAGRFVDDIVLPGMLHAAFVRSPVAHGRITRIDAAAARAAEGVRAVLTYADLRPLMTCDRIPLALPSAAIRFDVDPALARRRRGLPCRRARGDRGGGKPPHRRGCRAPRRARHRAAAGRRRSVRRRRDGSTAGAARLPGQSRRPHRDRLRRRRQGLRRCRASHRRALPSPQGRRPFDRAARRDGEVRRRRSRR